MTDNNHINRSKCNRFDSRSVFIYYKCCILISSIIPFGFRNYNFYKIFTCNKQIINRNCSIEYTVFTADNILFTINCQDYIFRRHFNIVCCNSYNITVFDFNRVNTNGYRSNILINNLESVTNGIRCIIIVITFEMSFNPIFFNGS